MTSYTNEHQYRPNITLNNTPIQHAHKKKILEVTYNTSMTFGPHINNIMNNANIRLDCLWSLGGAKFGQVKETIAPAYKQFNRKVLTNASLAWMPALSNTNIQKLQTLQNKAP
jgi:hypothetical protein